MVTNLISRALPLLNKFVPSALAIKGLGKIDPKIEKFMSGAFGSGYTSNEVLDFLRDKLGNQENQAQKNILEQGETQGTLRPDQLANLNNIRRSQELPNTLANAITGGAALAGGIGAMGSSENEPEHVEGEEWKMGFPSSQGPKTNPPARSREQSSISAQPGTGKDPLEFLAGYSAPLARAIGLRIQHGSLPKDAAFVLKNKSGPLKKVIENIESQTHEEFEDLIERLFGQREAMQAKFGNRKELMQQAQAQAASGNTQALIQAISAYQASKGRG